MRIRDVYLQYDIMPQLAEHMMRVAGVGKTIADNWTEKINADLVVRTCLLHDIGNMAKFDLSDAKAKKFGVRDVEVWREKQRKFWDKYGKDAHEATFAICSEIDQEDVIATIKEEYHGYNSNHEDLITSESWEAKILFYADFRVTPEGVVELEKRVRDLSERYKKPIAIFESVYAVAEQIAGRTRIAIDEIVESDVREYFPQFLDWKLA